MMKKLHSSIFKSILFSLILAFTQNTEALSQVSSGYTFTQGNAGVGGFITGGSLLASGGGTGSPTDNNVFPGQDIGFTFIFNGVSYTQIGVSTNGFIWFGNTAPAANEYNPISGSTAYDGVISAFGADLIGQTGSAELRIQTQGTTPNQTCTIMWKQFQNKSAANSGANRFDGWITLYECSNVIKTTLSANQYYWGSGVKTTGQVGLRGSSNSDFFNRNVTCSGSSWTTSTSGGNNAATCQMGGGLFGGCWPGTVGGTPCTYTYTPVSNPPCGSTTTITTGSISGSPFCAGASVSVPFTSTGTFNSGNTFTVQLSNASGSFASPVTIGSGAASPISATIPANTPAGSGYRIRVVSSNPATTGTDNGTNITVNASVTASVSISASSTTICTGSSVTFSATPMNGGTTPVYQWKVNGGNVGSGGAVFTTTTLNNNDVVTVQMTSNASCVTGSPATSSSITMTVTSNLTVAVTISADNSSVCEGTNVNFTATPSNGGTTPVYQWKVNGANAGTNSSSFSAILNNSDTVTCLLTSNEACATGSPAASNSVPVTVTPNAQASVTISTPSVSICSGETVTFTATPAGGGITPSYQWTINGQNAGTNSNSFSGSSLNNNDTVKCIMASSENCVTGSPATSNALIISVGNNASAGTISAVRDTICDGTPAILSVSGNSSTVQWQSSSSPNNNFSSITGQTATSLFEMPSTDTYYRVYVTEGSCSDTSASYKISVMPSPEGAFTYTQTGNGGKTISFDSQDSQGATAYEWAFGDGGTDNTPNPIHTFAKDTIYHVCLTVYNGSNCSFTICKDVQAGTTGIAVTEKHQSSWKIYPQPFTGFIVAENKGGSSLQTVEVFDLLGRVVFSNNFNNLKTTIFRIDLPELTTDMYLLKIKTTDAVDVVQILKL